MVVEVAEGLVAGGIVDPTRSETFALDHHLSSEFRAVPPPSLYILVSKIRTLRSLFRYVTLL